VDYILPAMDYILPAMDYILPFDVNIIIGVKSTKNVKKSLFSSCVQNNGVYKNLKSLDFILLLMDIFYKASATKNANLRNAKCARARNIFMTFISQKIFFQKTIFKKHFSKNIFQKKQFSKN